MKRFVALVGFSVAGAFGLLGVLAAPVGAQVCYRATSFSDAPPNIPASWQLSLTSQSCLSTPAGHGWARVWSTLDHDPLTYDLWIATPTSWHWTGCYHPQAASASQQPPQVYVNLSLGISCESAPFHETYEPPACGPNPLAMSLSGPSSQPLYISNTFTAFPTLGTGFEYWWSMRFHHPLYGWGIWSVPFRGNQSTTASSSTCGHNKFELKVEARRPGCSPSTRGSASKIVTITNYACPW